MTSTPQRTFLLFRIPPATSPPDTLALIRGGFAAMPDVRDAVCTSPPCQHRSECACAHIADCMAGTIDIAIDRASAELILTAFCGLPPEIANIIGSLLAPYKVSSYAHVAAIRQAPRALTDLHAEWYRVTARLWRLNDYDMNGDCSGIDGCEECRHRPAERKELHRAAGALIRKHKRTCTRLTAILMAHL